MFEEQYHYSRAMAFEMGQCENHLISKAMLIQKLSAMAGRAWQAAIHVGTAAQLGAQGGQRKEVECYRGMAGLAFDW